MKTLKICAVITLMMITNFAGFITSVSPQNGSNRPLEVSSLSSNNPFPSEKPVSVFVDPPNITAGVNDLVTFSVKVFNLTDTKVPDPTSIDLMIPLGNLWSLMLNFTWDPAILEYVNHTVTSPKSDTYPTENITYADGILNAPSYIWWQYLNKTGGLYHLELTSGAPAEPFNNPNAANKIFNMTFRVIGVGSTALSLPTQALGLADYEASNRIGEDMEGNKIYLNIVDGLFKVAGVPTASFSFWPEDGGVVDKPVIFNASLSEPDGGTIDSYEWDFGDETTGTGETTTHNYTEPGTYQVVLNVTDTEGKWAKTEKSVTIVESRNIEVKRASVLPEKRTKAILVNGTVDIEVVLKNDKYMDENITLTAYYNHTAIDLAGIISASDWTEIATEYIPIEKDYEKKMTIDWNTTGVPRINASYYVLINASIAPGVTYERNATDSTNIIVETPVFITDKPWSDAMVAKLDFGFLSKDDAFLRPAIEGEPETINVTVLNDGTIDDTFDLTLYINGLVNGTWTTDLLAPGKTQKFKWTGNLDSGSHNITAFATVENDVNNTNNRLEDTLRVIKPPKLEITYNPTSPVVNDTVTLDASASLHQEPGANITAYIWEIYNPYQVPGTDLPVDTLEGINVNYTVSIPGPWIVILKVTDNFDIEYDADRELGTRSYRKQISISVGAREFPILLIAAAVGATVAAVITGITLYRRRKS